MGLSPAAGADVGGQRGRAGRRHGRVVLWVEKRGGGL